MRGLTPEAPAERAGAAKGGWEGFVPRLFKRGRAGHAERASVRTGAGGARRDLLLRGPGRLREDAPERQDHLPASTEAHARFPPCLPISPRAWFPTAFSFWVT